MYRILIIYIYCIIYRVPFIPLYIYIYTSEGDASLVVLETPIFKGTPHQTKGLFHNRDFPGCLKKRRFPPANLCVRASPG